MNTRLESGFLFRDDMKRMYYITIIIYRLGCGQSVPEPLHALGFLKSTIFPGFRVGFIGIIDRVCGGTTLWAWETFSPRNRNPKKRVLTDAFLSEMTLSFLSQQKMHDACTKKTGQDRRREEEVSRPGIFFLEILFRLDT